MSDGLFSILIILLLLYIIIIFQYLFIASFQYRPRATSKNIENHEPGERLMRHQSIRQNSKHSREA